MSDYEFDVKDYNFYVPGIKARIRELNKIIKQRKQSHKDFQRKYSRGKLCFDAPKQDISVLDDEALVDEANFLYMLRAEMNGKLHWRKIRRPNFVRGFVRKHAKASDDGRYLELNRKVQRFYLHEGRKYITRQMLYEVPSPVAEC